LRSLSKTNAQRYGYDEWSFGKRVQQGCFGLYLAAVTLPVNPVPQPRASNYKIMTA